MNLDSERLIGPAMTAAGFACLVFGTAVPVVAQEPAVEPEADFFYGPTVVLADAEPSTLLSAEVSLAVREEPSTIDFLELASDIIASQEVLESDIQQVIATSLRRYLG